LTGAFVL